MRAELGTYGATHMITPHLDALAQDGMVFERAYVAISLCMPSRTAFLTSRRPATTHNFVIAPNEQWRQTKGPNATTLPEFFKTVGGYRTYGMGKIFHGTTDEPYSWSAEMGDYYDWDNWTQYGNSMTYKCFDVPDNNLGDGIFADRAVNWINMFGADQANGSDTRPFFMGVGFHRPHIPYLVPKRYCDMYPPADEIPLAANPFKPEGMPDVAYSVSAGLRNFQDCAPLFENVSKCYDDPSWAFSNRCYMVNGTLKTMAQNVRRNYWAAISYIDAQVGRIVQALKDNNLYDNTIVLFMGDHGVCTCTGRSTNFEHGTRIPLIIRDPSHTPARTAALVETVDIYPTLVDLAGLPSLETCAPGSMAALCTEGFSMRPLFTDPTRAWKSAAFSQYARPAPSPDNGFPADLFSPPLHVAGHREGVMGFTIRTNTYRYTNWVWFDPASATPHWNMSWGEELYNHTAQPVPDGLFNNENINLIDQPGLEPIIDKLRQALQAGWRAALPS
ncbi:uncharacterized protein MONBRDRAFT_22994 [Monosiga brevicollis MX1]|uniref:Sulfatase N-terminal domain-containing protein n=1 Tax=Monosiga brevicollis TaxID=81824 RepID=A9USP4_MONBE|nr:uncharacterized protein MONBRDRAFT_22994 [Monosiga brevicollis MX1]EDQ92138.1 predicted protein [Monosiga brevicollis MX1]|eukprot:XP_001743424.1 hypothetical protein [Monosiga brevicollis MX1]